MFYIKGVTDTIAFIFYMRTNTFSVIQKAAVRHMQTWSTSGLKHTHRAGEQMIYHPCCVYTSTTYSTGELCGHGNVNTLHEA